MIKGYQKFSSSECALSRVQLFATPWTVACQAPLSMRSPRQENWSGLPFPIPGGLPDPGSQPESLVSPSLAGDSLSLVPLEKSDLFKTMWPGHNKARAWFFSLQVCLSFHHISTFFLVFSWFVQS